MPCPVASVLLLSMIFGGIWTLLVQDRARRLLSWSVLLLLLLLWTIYYPAHRTVATRVILEVLSIAAWLLGMWRVYRLMRYAHVVPPFTRSLSRLYEKLKPIVSNRWVLALKVLLVLMLLAEAVSFIDFSWLTYGALTLLLVGIGIYVGIRAQEKIATEHTTG